jgi:hypothetical protein
VISGPIVLAAATRCALSPWTGRSFAMNMTGNPGRACSLAVPQDALPGGGAAIDQMVRPRDEACPIRQKKDDQGGHVF